MARFTQFELCQTWRTHALSDACCCCGEPICPLPAKQTARRASMGKVGHAGITTPKTLSKPAITTCYATPKWHPRLENTVTTLCCVLPSAHIQPCQTAVRPRKAAVTPDRGQGTRGQIQCHGHLKVCHTVKYRPNCPQNTLSDKMPSKQHFWHQIATPNNIPNTAK